MNVYVEAELSGIPLIVLDVVMGSCGMNLPWVVNALEVPPSTMEFAQWCRSAQEGQNGTKTSGNVSVHRTQFIMVIIVSTTHATMGESGMTLSEHACAQTTKYGIEMLAFPQWLPVTMVEYGMLVCMLVFVQEAPSLTSTNVTKFPSVQEVKSTIPSIIYVNAHMDCCSVILDVWSRNVRMVSIGIHTDVQQ